MNVANRPEYGWRVKSAKYSADVLAEYALYWHYGPCYDDASTTQSFQYQFNFNGSLDLSNLVFLVDGVDIMSNNNPPNLSSSGLVTWIMSHKVTPTGYTITSSSSTITIRRSDNVLPDITVTATGLSKGDSKHSYTMWTKNPPVDKSGCTPLGTNNYCTAPATGATDPHIGNLGGASGNVADSVTTVVGNVKTTTITYTNGTTAKIVTTTNADGTVTIVTTDAAGVVTTQVIANSSGGSGTSGLLSGSTSGIGRISWRELIKK